MESGWYGSHWTDASNAKRKQNEYIIVTLTDYFSKWAEAAPLADKTANGVARFIYSVSTCSNEWLPLFLFNSSVDLKIVVCIA